MCKLHEEDEAEIIKITTIPGNKTYYISTWYKISLPPIEISALEINISEDSSSEEIIAKIMKALEESKNDD